ncbi:MAG: BREX-1 system adenine-specific DNA-methyltransferase PglX [Paludibacteraceae bacterium]|nr:BREX-1 system adenine-specific DNA-methyltransferase PglX [Paludibacteraceae bacterium]
MDTGRLKRFSTEARTILMQGVKNRLQALGFDLKTGKAEELPQEMEGGAVFMNDVVSTDFYRKWMSLYRNVQVRSIREVAEEAAYTWFNRLMAIRIMEKRGFIAPVLEFESNDIHIPAIVNEATQGRLPEMTEAMYSQLMDLLDDPSKVSEQFTLLIVAYCHDNPIINNCFGAIADYTELLLPINILSEGGFVDMINETEFITEEQYASAELIGWLYQFYISDRKDEAFAKKGKYDPDEIAPATQIFTPNWIVKYMVQNTIGRIYLDNNPYEDELKEKWKYLVEPSEKTSKENIFHLDDLKELKFADLASGSGHILNEGFDILFDLYINEGYSRSEAIKNIFRYNLVGIDIDTRAKQLATFALLMKACGKDKSFLDAKVMPRVYSMPRPINEVLPNYDAALPNFLMGSNQKMQEELRQSLKLMNNADTLGSIMKFYLSDATRNTVMVRVREYEEQLSQGEIVTEENRLLLPYMRIILALTDRYAAICMNPPYMGGGRFDTTLSNYVKKNYSKSKADLFAVFMEVAIDRLADYGKYGMINMHSWMFLSSFEELRCSLLDNQNIDSLLHLGPRTFDELSGEVVQNAAFIISNNKTDNNGGTYFRLVDGRNCGDKERMFIKANSSYTDKVYYPNIKQEAFRNIPGRPIGYWVSNNVLNLFNVEKSVGDICFPLQGLSTTDNGKYIRTWYEVSFKQIKFGTKNSTESEHAPEKWYPINKGGGNKKWYGNQIEVINWHNNGEEVKNNPNAVIRGEDGYFKPSVTWNKICSTSITFRYFPEGFIIDSASNAIPCDDIASMLGYLCSKVTNLIGEIMNPTLNLSNGVLGRFPYLGVNNTSINTNVSTCLSISKEDWNAHETSWDFETHPLLKYSGGEITEEGETADLGEIPDLIEELYNMYKAEWEMCFEQLHDNEEELNRKFIEIYGLQEELTPDVPLDEITILQQGEIKIEGNELKWNADVVMKQLISYAIGCMMGRYSIDKPGLILANQGDCLEQFNEQVPDSRFEPDDDGIIPLMSAQSDFADNATIRFKQWLVAAFGEDTLVENLNFIEKCLGKSIDDYFVKDFWKDHKKMYQNRPIYWLFSSKKGAFQCLAYMHRMDAYTAERIRTKYLLPHIEWLMQKQGEMEANAANLNARERKELDNIGKQIEECREYHDRLHVIADKQIAFDLDDGVVVNYAKFGDVLCKLK